MPSSGLQTADVCFVKHIVYLQSLLFNTFPNPEIKTISAVEIAGFLVMERPKFWACTLPYLA